MFGGRLGVPDLRSLPNVYQNNFFFKKYIFPPFFCNSKDQARGCDTFVNGQKVLKTSKSLEKTQIALAGKGGKYRKGLFVGCISPNYVV